MPGGPERAAPVRDLRWESRGSASTIAGTPMTYCVAALVNDGLVFASDTRTSAGVDDVRTHNKMHVFEWPGERVLIALSAGNLATTHALLAEVRRDLENPEAPVSLRT